MEQDNRTEKYSLFIEYLLKYIEDLLAFYRVSSVLNRDVKQFGKKFLFDGDDDTCWNSGEVRSKVL